MCDKESYKNTITRAWEKKEDPKSVSNSFNNLIVLQYDYSWFEGISY